MTGGEWEPFHKTSCPAWVSDSSFERGECNCGLTVLVNAASSRIAAVEGERDRLRTELKFQLRRTQDLSAEKIHLQRRLTDALRERDDYWNRWSKSQDNLIAMFRDAGMEAVILTHLGNNQKLSAEVAELKGQLTAAQEALRRIANYLADDVPISMPVRVNEAMRAARDDVPVKVEEQAECEPQCHSFELWTYNPNHPDECELHCSICGHQRWFGRQPAPESRVEGIKAAETAFREILRRHSYATQKEGNITNG